MSGTTIFEKYNLTLYVTSGIMIILCFLATLKVLYETIFVKEKGQFVVVYGLLVLTMLNWFTLFLNQAMNLDNINLVGLYCFSSVNPSSCWEIWLFCWTYYTGIVDSTNMRTEVDSVTKAVRWSTQIFIWSGTFVFSVVYWHYYKNIITNFTQPVYWLRSSQVWLGWQLLVTSLATVLFLLSIIKLSYMIDELNKRSKVKVQMDKFVTFMHLFSLLMIVFASFINFFVSIYEIGNETLARCQIVVTVFQACANTFVLYICLKLTHNARNIQPDDKDVPLYDGNDEPELEMIDA